MENTRKLTTSAFMVAIAAVLALGVYIIPIAQGMIFVVGLPLIIIGVKYDWKTQLLASSVLILILAMLDPLYAIIILFLIGPMAMIQGHYLKNKRSTSEIIFFGTLAFVFGILSLLYISNLVFNINVIEETSTYTTEIIDELKVMYTNMDLLEASDLRTFLAGLEQFKSFVMMMVPSVIIMFSLFNSTMSYVLVSKVFKRVKIAIKKTHFKDFRINQQRRTTLMLVMLVVTIVSFIDTSNMDYYVFNFMSILMLLFQINGLALVWYLTDHHPKKKMIRVLSIIAYIVSPIVIFLELIVRYGLAVIGLMDMYINLREKIQTKKN